MPGHPFKDHFSGHASEYARYRPGYPDALFAYLASLTEGHDLAWDCATGNGQAAQGLARHFRQVIATDASAEQIGNAPPHDRITYRVEPAERTSLANGSVDLITVAQALHWFEFDAFFAEARRVLKPGGTIAAIWYIMEHVSPEVDRIKDRYYAEIVGPYWPPERRYVDEGYRTVPFPFAETPSPHFHAEAQWTAKDFLGYLATWSATKRYQQANEASPTDLIRSDLLAAWGDPGKIKEVRWSLYLRVGRHVG